MALKPSITRMPSTASRPLTDSPRKRINWVNTTMPSRIENTSSPVAANSRISERKKMPRILGVRDNFDFCGVDCG